VPDATPSRTIPSITSRNAGIADSLATYRSIYGFGALSRYNWGPVPPIHIIVKNGNVTLAGVVANETDRDMAALRANGVSGVFSVNNSLKVEKGS